MITSLSWKNIWRSHKRSFVVIGSIAVGVWALSFLFAFMNSFNEGYIRNAVKYDYSHLQIHHPEYRLDPSLDYTVKSPSEVVTFLNNLPQVTAFSSRTLVAGMVASSKNSQGVQITGVDPGQEDQITALKSDLLLEGTYFESNRNPILISKKVAEKLGVGIRSKVVITFQDHAGEITSAAFRVDGIFESKSPRINEGYVYVRQGDIQRLVQTDGIHEIGILLHESGQIEEVRSALKSTFPELEIRSYNELAPEFDLIEQQSQISKQVLTIIIMLALLFGIINTMLMAVLERTRELGMLRAVGLHKSKVFRMIMLETLFLSLVGGPLGIVLGALTNLYFSIKGMDLSAYSDMLKDYGYDTIFYPDLDPMQYPVLMLAVMLTAIFGAIYPAIKAVKLNPVESIRKI